MGLKKRLNWINYLQLVKVKLIFFRVDPEFYLFQFSVETNNRSILSHLPLLVWHLYSHRLSVLHSSWGFNMAAACWFRLVVPAAGAALDVWLLELNKGSTCIPCCFYFTLFRSVLALSLQRKRIWFILPRQVYNMTPIANWFEDEAPSQCLGVWRSEQAWLVPVDSSDSLNYYLPSACLETHFI